MVVVDWCVVVLCVLGSGVVVVVVVDGVSVFVVVEFVVLESVDIVLLGEPGVGAGVVAVGLVCWQPVITRTVAAKATARILL